jgi:hypothetical protein
MYNNHRVLISLKSKQTGMKRKILIGAGLLFVAWAFTACEALGDCGFCKTVTYENGVVINTGTETEYCGADLISQKAKPDITVGSLVTKVECR